MPKWTEYTSKDTLADNDEVMLYDATARANKRGLMSKFWDYVVDKMSTAVISKLETENKTVIGALNYLYGNMLSYKKIQTNSYIDCVKECREKNIYGIYLCGKNDKMQDAPPDSKNWIAYILVFASSDTGVSMLLHYDGDLLRIGKVAMNSGESTINWNNII